MRKTQEHYVKYVKMEKEGFFLTKNIISNIINVVSFHYYIKFIW